MSDIGNPRGTEEDLGSDVKHCFCCKKQFDRNKMDYIDGRYVCKSCNHLKEVKK